MDLEVLKRNFKELNEKIETAQREMAEKSTGFIEAMCKEFFDACPQVESIFWRQYTPHFNDGEPCEFSVHDKYFTLFDDPLADEYEGSEVYSTENLQGAEVALTNAILYNKDPMAWQEKYKQDYFLTYNRVCTLVPPRPYSYDVSKATKQVQEIKDFMEKYPPEVVDNIKANFNILEMNMNLISEKIMETIYGDHVQVKITRDGTEIDEYEHD